MYATCTFCHGALGRNESIEVFPVGKRLAFDSDRGRLWVICPRCAQWNLSPLEERWEAIESAERLFRASKLRHSTANIGLARLSDHTELIRIGKPVRAEMAAWRYGQNFIRRWRGMAVGAGAGSAIMLGTALLLPGAGVAAGIAGAVLTASGALVGAVGSQAFSAGSKAVRGQVVVDNESQYVRVSPKELGFVRLIAQNDGWALRVPYQSRRPVMEDRWHDVIDLGGVGFVTISGQPAVTAARQLLPLINGRGARSATVNEAVALATTWDSTESAFAWSLNRSRELTKTQLFGDPGSLYHLPAPVRLALEMSLHEQAEQRALEGELAQLEREWKTAEEIASIADGLFVTGRVDRLLAQFRGRNPMA